MIEESTRLEMFNASQIPIYGDPWIKEQPRKGDVEQIISAQNHGNIKLNLGCGIKRFHKPDYINIDISEDCKADLWMDVECEQFPFEENSVMEIRADNLLEHFSDLIHCMNECHLMLKPGGTFWFRVPAVDRFEIRREDYPVSDGNEAIKVRMFGAFRDPTHKKFFCEGTMDYWNGNHPTWKNYGRSYGFKPWTVKTEVFHNPSNGLFFYDTTQSPIKA